MIIYQSYLAWPGLVWFGLARRGAGGGWRGLAGVDGLPLEGTWLLHYADPPHAAVSYTHCTHEKAWVATSSLVHQATLHVVLHSLTIHQTTVKAKGDESRSVCKDEQKNL